MQDYLNLFQDFLKSNISLEVLEGEKLVFSSRQEMLTPLLEYIDTFGSRNKDVVIFDKIMGNAAALLCVIARCKEVFTPLGSEPAIKTLKKYGVIYHFTDIVPFILQPKKNELCPMEKLSLGKTPEEFYQTLKTNKRENVF